MKIFLAGRTNILAGALETALREHELVWGVADEVLDDESFASRMLAEKPGAIIDISNLAQAEASETGARNVALAAKISGARLFYVSSAEVFSGRPPRTPWAWGEMDIPRPETDFGLARFAGEQMVQLILPDAVILRTHWLYAEGADDWLHNLVRTGHADANVRGNPTPAKVVAEAIRFIVSRPDVSGFVHATCEDQCTMQEAGEQVFGWLGSGRKVEPVAGEERTFALKKSVLNVLGYRTPNWRDALMEFVKKEFN